MGKNPAEGQCGAQPKLFVENYGQIARLGLWGFPISNDGTKLPWVKWKEFQDRPPSPDELAGWRKLFPHAGVGIPTGIATGVVIIDADNHDAINHLESRGIPKTWRVRTRRGRHFYFAHPDFVVANSAGRIADHIDVRGRGGFVVAPGSLGKDGFEYKWEPDFSPDDVALAGLPDWLMNLLRPKPQPERPLVGPKAFAGEMTAYARKALEGELDRLRNAGDGTRNDTAAKVAFNLGNLIAGGELDDGVVRIALYQIADGWPNATKTRDTIDRTLEAGKEHPRCRPKSHALRVVRRERQPELATGDSDESGEAMGDIRIADKFLEQHGDNVRWCPTRGWLVWDSRRWRWDEREHIVALAEKTVRQLYREAAATNDEKEREAILRLAGTYRKSERVRHMLEFARTHVAVVQDELDRDVFLLNCRNGTVDLRDGQLRPHDREDLITKITNLDHLGNESKAPRFEQFMIEVFQGHTDLIEYVQRAIGYSFTGDQREQELYFAHGGGANGKGTLINVLLKVAGDYGHVAPSEMLLARKFGDAIPTDRADLCGKRFVSVNETGEGRALAEGLVKSITGNDPISARRMRENYFTFMPTHHIWLSSNHKPNVSGSDFAIWRRINLIPFERKFEGDADDKNLPAVLHAELSGILSWIVRGAVAWFKDGRLRKPEVVIAATKQYRDEEDVLGDFIRECCEVGANLEVPFKDLYRSYKAWCEENGMRPWTATRLGRRLADSGYPSVHCETGSVRKGLELRK